MKIYGVDFTSVPTLKKAITCVQCRWDQDHLILEGPGRLISFDEEEDANLLIQDGSGDPLDALLCAIQAGWAYSQRDRNFGIPLDCDPLEGWIVDSSLMDVDELQNGRYYP